MLFVKMSAPKYCITAKFATDVIYTLKPTYYIALLIAIRLKHFEHFNFIVIHNTKIFKFINDAKI